MENTAPPLRGWIGYPVGFLAAIVVTTAAIAAHGTAHPEWTLAVLAATALVVAALATLRAGLMSALFCWALFDGFVLGREGQLAMTADSAKAAATLVAVATIGCAAATILRHAGRISVPARPFTYLSAQQERLDSAR